MLVKNQIYEAEITDYTAEGRGVAHIEGCAVFIPNAVAGEKVRVRVEKAQKTWAAGKIVEILEKSPHRVNRECEVAKLCGGCDFWHMDYAEETRLKAERVKNCLNRIGGENLAEVPILAAPDCHGYRNKAQYPVAVKKGRAYAGFYRAGTHDVVENARCRILPEEIDAAKDAVIDYVNQYRVSVYDEATSKGLLRPPGRGVRADSGMSRGERRKNSPAGSARPAAERDSRLYHAGAVREHEAGQRRAGRPLSHPPRPRLY